MHPFFLYLRNAVLGGLAGFVVTLIAAYFLAEYTTRAAILPPPTWNDYFVGGIAFLAPGLVPIGMFSSLMWTHRIQTSAPK